MSNRRLIRHVPGVSMALLLLVSLVPAAQAQLPANPNAGNGGVQGVVVDGNTRESLPGVINVIAVAGVCPLGVVPVNPLTNINNLPPEVIAAIPTTVQPVNGVPGPQLRCTSVSDVQGRWGFSQIVGAVTVTHLAFKTLDRSSGSGQAYSPHTDQFQTVISTVATSAVLVQHDFAMALQPGPGSGTLGGIPGAITGTITGNVLFGACDAGPVPPAAPVPATGTTCGNPVAAQTDAAGQFLNPVPPNAVVETRLGTSILGVEIGGPSPGNVNQAYADANGAYQMPIAATGVARPVRVSVVDPGGGQPNNSIAGTGPFCNNAQTCHHQPLTVINPVTVTAGGSFPLNLGPLALATAPPANPAGFVPGPPVNTAGSSQNDLGGFGYVIDISTGQFVNGVTVSALCTVGNCANNVTGVTTNNPNTPPIVDGGRPGYFIIGGLSRGTPYTFRITAVPAGFRIVDACQVSQVTPSQPLNNAGTWMGLNLCVESLGVLQPVPGASVLAGRVVDPIQITSGAPTPLSGVLIVAVRIDGTLIGNFSNPFTGFVEAAPTTQSDAGGNWVIAGVPPGTYRITALDNVNVLCNPAGNAPAVAIGTLPGGIQRQSQTGGCGHIPASQPPAGQPGVLAPPDAVTVVPDLIMPPMPAPNTSLAVAAGSVPPVPPDNRTVVAVGARPGGIFGYVWDGVLGTPAQGATVQVRSVAALGPEVLSSQLLIQPYVQLAPQVLPGVGGLAVATGFTSFSGRYEIPGLQPGTQYIVTVTGGISVPRVEKSITIAADQWKAGANFALLNSGLIGLPGGPAGGRLELVFPLISRGGNADIYGVPIETTRIKIQNTGGVRTLASIFWCSSTFAIGGVGTADCGAGDSIDLNPAASVAIAPPAGFFGSALVFTSAPPIGPAPGQSPPGAYALVNLEGIAEYLVGDHQSFTIAAGIPAEELSQAYMTPGNASVIGMAYKNWNPSTEWNSVVSAMNITNSPQPVVFTLLPTRGVPGGPVQVIRTAPAFGVSILDLRTIPDIPPRWMGAVWVQSSGGIPPIAQLPGSQVPGSAAVQGLTSSFQTNSGPFIQTQPGTATAPLAYVVPGGARASLFLPGGIASAAISYTNRAQLATASDGIYNGELVFITQQSQPPTGTPFNAGAAAIGQIYTLPLVYSGFDGWETGLQVTNALVGGSISFSMEVFNENGQQIETIQDRVANLSGVSYFFGARNAPDYKVGTVRIRPTDGGAVMAVTAQAVNYSRGMAFQYNAFNALNTSIVNIATGAQDVQVALGNETCVGINQPATYIGGQPLQMPTQQCLYVPSVRKDISIDPDTGRVRLGWTSGIRVMHGDDYQPVPIQLTLRYFDPSGFEWVIAREAVVISSPYQAHTWFLGNTASLPTGFDGSAIVTSTSPRVFGLGTVIDYARPSAVPGQPPADRADVFPLPNAAGFIN